jgi:hypothetical protein
MLRRGPGRRRTADLWLRELVSDRRRVFADGAQLSLVGRSRGAAECPAAAVQATGQRVARPLHPKCTDVQQVATRAADAAGFAPPTTIPGSQLLGPANASVAAIDPTTGIPIVAWAVAGEIDLSHGPAL